MEVFFSGAWRTPKRAELVIGGAWRTITRGEAVLNGNWHTIASFVPPLSLTVNPLYADGRRVTPKPTSGSVVTNIITATPNGGAGPYYYVWSIISGTAIITSPNTASTSFSAILPPESEREAVAQVTCTDSNGHVASEQVSISFINSSLQ